MSERASVEYLTEMQYLQELEWRRSEVPDARPSRLAILLDQQIGPHVGILTVGKFIELVEGVGGHYTGKLVIAGELLATERNLGWRQLEPGLWRAEGHQRLHVPIPHIKGGTRLSDQVVTPDRSSYATRRVSELFFSGSPDWDGALSALLEGRGV